MQMLSCAGFGHSCCDAQPAQTVVILQLQVKYADGTEDPEMYLAAERLRLLMHAGESFVGPSSRDLLAVANHLKIGAASKSAAAAELKDRKEQQGGDAAEYRTSVRRDLSNRLCIHTETPARQQPSTELGTQQSEGHVLPSRSVQHC